MNWKASLSTLSERGWRQHDVIETLVRLLRSPELHWRMSGREMGRAVGRRLDDGAAAAVLGIARTWLLGADVEREELLRGVRRLDD